MLSLVSPHRPEEREKGFMAGNEGSCWGELRPPPLNLTPQSSSPFIRKFDQFSPGPSPSPTELHSRGHKRKKVFSDGKDPNSIPVINSCLNVGSMYMRQKSLPDVIDYSDPFAVSNLKEELVRGMYGSVTKDIEDLCARRSKLLHPLLAFYPSLSSRNLDNSAQSSSCLDTHDAHNGHRKDVRQMMNGQISDLASREIIDLDDDCKSYVDKMQGFESLSYMEMPKIGSGLQNHNDNQIVVIDSDDEENAEQILNTQVSRYGPYASNFEVAQGSQSQDPHYSGLDQGKSLVPYSSTTFKELYGPQNGKNRHLKVLRDPTTLQGSDQETHYNGNVLRMSVEEKPIKDFAGKAGKEIKGVKEPENPNTEKESKKDKGIYVGVQDDGVIDNGVSQCDSDDGLGDIWRDMTVALECNKDALGDTAEYSEDEEAAECDHSFLLKDDLGYVCRVCGVIKKSIETIFDYQWGKGSKITRTYVSESRSTKGKDESHSASLSGFSTSHQLEVVDIAVHPRHMKQMKPHQIEGFNFLVKNLISGDPGGCILAHAPGSGKTFMIISFIQSFLAKYPNARPLVVLPKGILGTWKREFTRWQVENMPLYDFYSSKAEGRKEQLDILKEWVQHRGILFLGYKQFANIVSKSESDVAAACQDILLKVPTILICDEGHTPRNQDTDVLHSLEKVQTPRKVVLSGTLFQNHVKEVFNILNLVRPKFLKSDASKVIKRRVMSRGRIGRKHVKAGVDAAFFDVVEQTLQHDENSKVKIAVIQDLREMTKDVLHYYKGDFLDELPGLVDLTVLLNLSPKQKSIVEKLKKMEKFKRASIGTAVYVHPLLNDLSHNATTADKGWNVNDDRINSIINNMDIRDGVKAKFFLNIMRLCESSGEKLLVFSQYLLPLKFLEKLLVSYKGWSPGKEIFMINGDTSSEDREWSMERFNNSPDAKVFFGSIKACGEGISLVGASRILIMDVHLNPSVTRQAIGRAFRPGQVRKVYVYRLVASDSPEEESHDTSFRKELISKMWFEWSEYCSNSTFEMETVSLKDSDDEFWESPSLKEDVNTVKKR